MITSTEITNTLIFAFITVLVFQLPPNQQLPNKGIKQTINSRRIVFIGYWRTVQRIMTSLQQRKTGCTSWTKTSRLQSQIGVTIFASFWQEKLGGKTGLHRYFL